MSHRHHVELTERSISVDGVDVSSTAYEVNVSVGVDRLPAVQILHHPELFTFVGSAVVENRPYDGIERLRERFAS